MDAIFFSVKHLNLQHVQTVKRIHVHMLIQCVFMHVIATYFVLVCFCSMSILSVIVELNIFLLY